MGSCDALLEDSLLSLSRTSEACALFLEGLLARSAAVDACSCNFVLRCTEGSGQVMLLDMMADSAGAGGVER